MNSLLLLIIGVPAIEIYVMIKIGHQIGALNTIIMIFLTAIIGIYFVKIQGVNTVRSGLLNLYQNKMPIYEIVSGASLAIAAILLIIPGFITDIFGFILLFPITRKILAKKLIKKQEFKYKKNEEEILDGEIIENKTKDDKL